MLSWLAHRVIKDAWFVVITWALLAPLLAALALTGLGGPSLAGRLAPEPAGLPGTESAVGQQVLDSLAGDGAIVTLLVTDIDLGSTARQEDIAAALTTTHADLSQLVGTTNVLDPFVVPGMLSSPAARSMASKDLDSFIIVVTVNPNGTNVAAPDDQAYFRERDALVDKVTARLEEVPGELATVAPGAQGVVSHQGIVDEAVSTQVVSDLLTVETIALPVALVVLVLALGSLLAAGLSLLAVLVSLAASLGAIYGLSLVMDIQPFVLAVCGLLATALSAAYALLLTGRYREELRRSGQELALEDHAGRRRRRSGRRDLLISSCMTTALRTTGRSLMLLALAMGVGLACLALLGGGVLQSTALAGAVVVLVCLGVVLTLLPACLALQGRRLAAPSPLERLPLLGRALPWLRDPGAEQAARVPHPSRVRRQLAARPWAVVVGCLLVLMVLALPLRQLHLLTSSTAHLPPDSPQHAYWATLEEDYPAAAGQDATMILAGTGTRITDFINNQVASVPGVQAVLSPSTAGDYTVVYLDLQGDASSASAEEAVAGLRAVAPPVDTWVTGQAASQLDVRQTVLGGLPRAAGVVVLTTAIVLFLLTGSLLISLKALLVSVPPLAASFGLLVWFVQEGPGASLVGLAPTGGLGATVVVAGAALGLGLTLGNEVMLLSRVIEYRQSGFDDATSMERGLQHAGRAITVTSLLMAAVLVCGLFARLPDVKEIGLALAVIVVLDAALVRRLLVPAVMTLLGTWSWWAPAWLVGRGRPVARVMELTDVPGAPPSVEGSVDGSLGGGPAAGAPVQAPVGVGGPQA